MTVVAYSIAFVLYGALQIGVPTPTAPPASPPQATAIPAATAAAQSSRDELAVEVLRLREKVEGVAGKTNLLITILAVVLALGGLTSVTSWGKHEFVDGPRDRRAADHTRALLLQRDLESHSRAGEAHSLMIRGETAAQDRSDEVHRSFLAGSKDTLELVNATLTLAKEASERAAKAVERRAKVILQKLDIESKELLASVPAQDDRALVADPARTATLRSLAQRIEGFQINRIILPEEMELSSECLFVRGMDFHLKQQYDDAFEAWKEVTHGNGTSETLRSLAWYWIGYEQNNLGLFPQAILSFQRALESAAGIRKYELQRILVESRFFNKESEEPLLDSLESLLASTQADAGEGIASARRKILGTIGNIHIQRGNDARKRSGLDSALAHYSAAQRVFSGAKDQDKWALFGYAEASYWLNDPEAVVILRDKSRRMAVDEEIRRIEPRTKVLARTTELICCLRVAELKPEVPAIYSQVTEALGRVEGTLTVYSLVQRRNVTKDEFRRDLLELMAERTGADRPLTA